MRGVRIRGTGRINRDTRQFLCEAGDGLARSIVLDALNIEGLNAGQWTYCRFLLSNPADHVFAQVAAQVPQCPRILCGNDDANRDGRCIRVGDLDGPRAPVPQVRCQEKFLHLVSDQGHGSGPIQFELDRAELFGGSTRPIFESV